MVCSLCALHSVEDAPRFNLLLHSQKSTAFPSALALWMIRMNRDQMCQLLISLEAPFLCLRWKKCKRDTVGRKLTYTGIWNDLSVSTRHGLESKLFIDVGFSLENSSGFLHELELILSVSSPPISWKMITQISTSHCHSQMFKSPGWN